MGRPENSNGYTEDDGLSDPGLTNWYDTVSPVTPDASGVFRTVPDRTSVQAWVLGLATAGLFALFPFYTAKIFVAEWDDPPVDLRALWQEAETVAVVGRTMRVPKVLSRNETRSPAGDRIVFGVSLAEILATQDPETRPRFSRSVLRQHVTLTFFRPDKSVFGLDSFLHLYGQYLEEEKSVGVSGLTNQHFDRVGPFDNESLYYQTTASTSPYFVRCFEGDMAGRLRTCFRNLRISDGLALRYSFDRALLRSWQGLETAIVSLADRMSRPKEGSALAGRIIPSCEPDDAPDCLLPPPRNLHAGLPHRP
ncbi:MAG: hypothetical protein AAGL24_15930 [Pseudomonadota bacterium]